MRVSIKLVDCASHFIRFRLCGRKSFSLTMELEAEVRLEMMVSVHMIW